MEDFNYEYIANSDIDEAYEDDEYYYISFNDRKGNGHCRIVDKKTLEVHSLAYTTLIVKAFEKQITEINPNVIKNLRAA